MSIKNLSIVLYLFCFMSCQSHDGRYEKTTENESEKQDPETAMLKTINKEKISLQIDNPYATISRIFSSYTEFQESSDLSKNKDSLKLAIELLGRDSSWISPLSLELLLNVWMYYDPTDFPTRIYVENRLKENTERSINAIEKRIQNKKKWERYDGAPFSELNYLKSELINFGQEKE